MRYTDPDGRLIHAVIGAAIGAFVGAAVSAGCEVFNQVVIQGKGLDGIDGRKVGIAAIGGAGNGSNKIIKDASKQMTSKISKEFQHNGVSAISSKTTKNAVTYFGKNTKSAVNSILSDIPDSVIISTTQNIGLQVKEELEN